MISTDYTAFKKCPFVVNVAYDISSSSKVGRIANKFADGKSAFSGGLRGNYMTSYGFNSKENADGCKAALDAAFAGHPYVKVSSVTDNW